MRKLLNTLYVTNENIYMTLDGENVVCKENNEVKLRLPFSNIEAIFCFSYLGCSPALMGKCADYGIPINFISPSGRFLARVQGASHGNVLLRKRQYELFSKPPALLRQNTVAAKLANTKSVVKRTLKDYPQIDEDGKLTHCIERLDGCIKACISQMIMTAYSVRRGTVQRHILMCLTALFFIKKTISVLQ